VRAIVVLALALSVAMPAMAKSGAKRKKPREVPPPETPSIPVTRIPRGDAVVLDAEVNLSRPAQKPLFARIVEVRNAREVRVLPFAEITTSNESSVHVAYAIAASHAASEGGHVFATLEIQEIGGGKAPLSRLPIEQVVEIRGQGLPATVEQIESDKRAFLDSQEVASGAYEKLRALQDDLRLDRLDPPPALDRMNEKDLPSLIAFFHHRMRAEIAREHLRTLADAADPKIKEAAVLAIGALTKKPTGVLAKGAGIEGERIERAFQIAESALDDLRIDEAEGELNKLRNGGKLEKPELARALVLLGGIAAVRAKAPAAAESFGGAFCIVEKIDPPQALRREPMMKRFVAAKQDPKRCTRLLSVDAPIATRVGDGVHVKASFGPDPFRLGAGGDIEIWGVGGALAKSAHVRVPDSGEREIEADFIETRELENYAGQLLLKVYVRDVSGVVIASAGDPDLLAVSYAEPPGGAGIDIPWWVWALAGGVAAAGAVTAGVVVLSNRQTKQGIGPVSAEF
jgi:hypothetical protein